FARGTGTRCGVAGCTQVARTNSRVFAPRRLRRQPQLLHRRLDARRIGPGRELDRCPGYLSLAGAPCPGATMRRLVGRVGHREDERPPATRKAIAPHLPGLGCVRPCRPRSVRPSDVNWAAMTPPVLDVFIGRDGGAWQLYFAPSSWKPGQFANVEGS